MTLLGRKHIALLDEAKRRGQPDVDNIRLCFEALALASAIDRACAARLAPHQLSEGKFTLLFLLRDLPEGLAPHELADRAGVTRATITGLLDGLDRDGFLARHSDRQDRRKVSVRLTSKGQTMARELFEEHSNWIGSLFAGFNQQERDMLSELLGRVGKNLDPSTNANATRNGRSSQ